MDYRKKISFHLDAVDKLKWLTARRPCIHKIPGLLLTYRTETYTPIFQHQYPPLYYIITCIILGI